MISPFSINAPSSLRLLEFSKALQVKGHYITLVLPRFDRYSGFTVDAQYSGVKIINPFQLKTGNLIADLIPYAFSAGIINHFTNYDIVHILKPIPITVFGYMAKFANVPIVIDIDDLDHAIMVAEKQSSINTWLVNQSEKIFPKLADHVVVSCSYLKRYYSEIGISSNKITQISNGVSVNDFKVQKNFILKKRYKLREKVVIYVGSLNNYSQLLPLIYSMQKIVVARRDTSCLIIGDGIAKESLHQLVVNLGIDDFFVFTGRVSHDVVPQFLSFSDVGFACFPSLDYFNYASNIKVFEYMAAGLPVIVSPTGDLPFYVNYGKAGIVSAPEVNQLSKEILCLLTDEKRLRQLSINARQRALNFDWNTLTDRLLNVYQELAK